MSLARWRDVWRRFSGRGTYPHELAFVLTLPLRRLIQPRRALVRQLALRPDARVLELGPGPGYWSGAVARALPHGRLVLCDLQCEMLAKARHRLAGERAANVAFAQAEATRLPFRDGAFDLAFLVAVLGEVPDPRACLEALRRVLAPDGRLSITETRGDPDALSLEELIALARASGFELAASSLGRLAFTAQFRPRVDPG
jgi:ubiquinone/menaquinone biosynthesis C-methylase UbiE